jgi:homocysteine S-methyltransferase
MLLTDAGMETVLVFDEGIDLPHFAAFPLVDTAEGQAALRRYYTPFLELSRDRDVGFVLSAPTWRANADWGALLGYDIDGLAAINRRAVAFAEAVRDEVMGPGERDGVVIEAFVGPRSDAYRPTVTMPAAEAERYHRAQLRALADTGTQQVNGITLAYTDEAIGIVRAATAVGLRVVISFTVETDGRLPTGPSIEEAITTVDNATDGASAGFMIKCVRLGVCRLLARFA